MSLRMARYLQERGVEKGDRVLLWAPNMPEWVELYFAGHAIGAVLVPLDVRSARDFVDAVIARTEPKVIVLSRVTARNAADLVDRAVYLGNGSRELPLEGRLQNPEAIQAVYPVVDHVHFRDDWRSQGLC